MASEHSPLALEWTDTQRHRLVELGAAPCDLGMTFDDPGTRNSRFQELTSRLAAGHKRHLAVLRERHRRPALRRLESELVGSLTDAGFVEVTTPLIMSRGLIEKMAILPGDPLHRQIYWIDENHCLRPMLAPHLYYVVKDLLRLWPKPVRIFEVGPCFRKESDGARHAPEFTMLNLCEFGGPDGAQEPRLRELAGQIMDTAGIKGYRFESSASVVYGTTLDVLDSASGLELASGALGPHALDKAWGITDTWVGLGFGLERLLMATSGESSLARFGRSISYLDGVRLNI